MEINLYWNHSSCPADGITFVFTQADIKNIDTLTAGGSLAGTLKPAFCIEFDIYRNTNPNDPFPDGSLPNDPPWDHIDFIKDGKLRHNNPNSCPRIQNAHIKIPSGWYKGKIVWYINPTGGYDLSLYMIENDDIDAGYQLKITKHFNQLSDFLSSANSNNKLAYWGFTAATGGCFSEQRVRIDNINGSVGDVIEIQAIPNDCYIFLHWTDISGNILTHLKQKDTITIRSDSTIIAVFETTFFPITVDKNIPEAGTVIAEQYGCDNVIEAIPNDCYYFVHWADAEGSVISTKQTDTIKLTSDSTLIAIFEEYDFSVTVHTNIAEAGEVEKEEYDCDNAIISATPNDCYRFVHWIDTDGKIISTKRIDTLKLTSDSTLIAIFENYDFSVTVHTNIAEAGEVEKEEDCDNAIISATPNDCYTFINWTDTDGKVISTQQIDTLKLFSDSTIIANFVLDTFELSLFVNPTEAGTVKGSGRYFCNEFAIYEAIPNDCYTFINWTDANSGEVVSTKLTDTILMIEDRKLIANFEFYNYNIVLSSEFYIDGEPLPAGYTHQLNHKTLVVIQKVCCCKYYLNKVFWVKSSIFCE